MAKTVSHKPVAHIYIFAFVWLFYALIGYDIRDGVDVFAIGLIAFAPSVIVYFIRNRRRKGKDTTTAPVVETPVEQVPDTGNPELDAVIRESYKLLGELSAARRNIHSRDIASKTDEIIDTSHKIIEKLRREPQLLSSAKRFFNYYLPTTTKLITNYSYMESQGVSGGNIANTMQKIEESLNSLATAYRTQLDTLFSHTAIDLETDIDALEQILKQEGLL